MGMPFRSVCMILLAFLCQCTRYGLLTDDDALQAPEARIRVPMSAIELETQLKNYLAEKKALKRRYTKENARILETRWKSDESLRYFFTSISTRKRHLSQWKGVWSILPKGNDQSELHLIIGELIYCEDVDGLSAQHPTISSEWYETNPDKLRASVEMSKFWKKLFPKQPLPRALKYEKAPELFIPPLAERQFSNKD